MDLLEAIEKRHSVRSYLDKKIEGEVLICLKEQIAACNKESGLRFQLVIDEPEAFSGMMARYGKFHNVKNYIALIGEKSENLEENIGYYGEKIAIFAQQLGLNTCWVAMTYKKGNAKKLLKEGEKVVCILAIGYGSTQGVPHRSRSMVDLCSIEDGLMPGWFRQGMEAAMLAPTAMNQQKFFVNLADQKVEFVRKKGPYTKVDLGIVKYHFEVGAGKENFSWL